MSELVRVINIKVITISDDCMIHIDDKIFGKVVIRLLDDNHVVIEGLDVTISGYSGESGFSITVPKEFINKKAIVCYEREVKAKKVEISADQVNAPDELKIKTNDNIAQAPTAKKKYHCFHVSRGSEPKDICAALNTQLNSLNECGWTVERIDCHDNPFGGWNSDERCYYTTREYIIVAYKETQNN